MFKRRLSKADLEEIKKDLREWAKEKFITKEEAEKEMEELSGANFISLHQSVLKMINEIIDDVARKTENKIMISLAKKVCGINEEEK